ncbi:glycosyltransferase family 4 protein [Pseudolysinimonas yzui]|uniref:Glycosyl transferase n=1 Tax=Pseudolysinimonas yzui TaxID=2708254 RepID=A0A8J3GSB1_9MICO|nr:glycosyltransferase family 4 protein [Pseudolysinimonas yzui]GHF22342.1 glycosyl transferase [Pseudolysinimonas yzui]
MTIIESSPRDPSSTPAGGSPLRIGVVAPPWFELPPTGYGGTEAVVAALVDQLVAFGHQVTLIASGPAKTKAQRQVTVYEKPPSRLLGHSTMPEVIIAAEAARVLTSDDFDIIHDHSLAGPLLAVARTIPTVVTMHGPVTGDNGDYFRRLGTAVDLVAISDSQRLLAPTLNWAGTVHNAVDVDSFPYRADKDDYVLWIGRFHPDKGAHLAIDAARAAGRRIVLAGKLNERDEHEYFDKAVRPKLARDAEYLGEADARLKRELFAGARCLVFPIQWDEPFGMVMIEALASGTPVVATRRGSVPEIVEDGRTGWVVDDLAELPAAIERAGQLDPAECRASARTRFDLPVMGRGYDRIYRALVETPSNTRRTAIDAAALQAWGRHAAG